MSYKALTSRSFWIGVIVVGTALTLINHGERLFTGSWGWDLAWKFLGTYVLSFLLVAYLVFTKDQE